jgi:calcium-dependent protein kinase
LTTSHENIRDIYIINSEIIGTGRCSHIRKAINIKTGMTVTVKTVNKNRPDFDRDIFLQELSVMQSLDHPNIIKFHEVYEDKF